MIWVAYPAGIWGLTFTMGTYRVKKNLNGWVMYPTTQILFQLTVVYPVGQEPVRPGLD